DLPVTTGDSYTVAIAVEALEAAARRMDIDTGAANVAVVGAGGAIGGACARLLAGRCAELVLGGRPREPLEAPRDELTGFGTAIHARTGVDAIYGADLIVTVTSAVHAVIEPRHLKPGAVVLDVARPRDVSRRVAEQRDDVLVIEGGMVEVPGPVDFG